MPLVMPAYDIFNAEAAPIGPSITLTLMPKSFNTPNLRYSYMLRVFNLWVRRFIPDRKGAAYELRKQAGSNWLEATGQISQVQYLLGHSTPTTTARWYATWQKAVTVPLVFQERPL